MRSQFGTAAGSDAAAAPALSITTLPAQSVDAIAVHFPYPLMAGGRVLPAGNYTISALKGGGETPILRFQSEGGEAISVMVTREELSFAQVALSSEVTLVPGSANIPRVQRVLIEGNSFQFLLPVSHFSN